jgi:pyridoxal biosynthesis lyase PdxS
MLLALSERGSESPKPISWPGRAPVVEFWAGGIWATAATVLMPNMAAPRMVILRMGEFLSSKRARTARQR